MLLLIFTFSNLESASISSTLSSI